MAQWQWPRKGMMPIKPGAAPVGAIASESPDPAAPPPPAASDRLPPEPDPRDGSNNPTVVDAPTSPVAQEPQESAPEVQVNGEEPRASELTAEEPPPAPSLPALSDMIIESAFQKPTDGSGQPAAPSEA